jgi:hypothetical protein
MQARIPQIPKLIARVRFPVTRSDNEGQGNELFSLPGLIGFSMSASAPG